MFVIGGIEFVDPRQFCVGQWRRFGRKPDQPFDQIVAGIGIERRLDPGKTLLGGEGFGLLFHLRGGKAFEQRNIDPGFAVVVVEQLTLDPAARGNVGIAANETGARIAAPDCAGEDHAPDAVGIGCVVGRGNLLEHPGLDVLVRGRAEGLGDIEGDFPGGQCLKHHRRKVRETQPAINEANGQTEAAGNVLDGRTARHERGKGLGFVGRVHGEAVKVLRKAGLDRDLSAIFEHEAGDFVIAGKDLFVCQREHGAATPLASFDLELSLRGRPNNEVLQQATSCDAGFELGIGS
ncbi:hypothetical protein SAMN06272759_101635 [Novosphingobium sp. B1]|nr:hypothetical protein SAMN06272759_101635 [Novosphingobium sp. B1]